MKIVFMGTPEFAVACLDTLADSEHELAAVFCQPDKPQGRGYVLTPPPVKSAALARGIEVFQPTTLRSPEALSLLASIAPELIVVTAYGKILPPDIIRLPKFGCINIHASLLPKYRGAAPIQWSVINGEAETGITSMQMDDGLDTGDMLLSESVSIGENETAGELHDRLSVLGARVLSQTLALLESGGLEPKKQDDSLSCYAPMLSKKLCPIDFAGMSARDVHNKIRGLSPWPAAMCELGGKKVKVYSSLLAGEVDGAPGEVVEHGERLVVACADGRGVELTELQLEGKKKLCARDFLRGFKL